MLLNSKESMEFAGPVVQNADSGRGTEYAVNDRLGHGWTRRGAALAGSPREVRRAATDDPLVRPRGTP